VVVEARGHNLTSAATRYENAYCRVMRLAHGKIVDIIEYADTQLMATALRDPG
jgi:uncharacterized protein